jgi:hypothetical protein
LAEKCHQKQNFQAGKKMMTFSNIVALMVMAMVTNVSSQMVRQIGQVVSAICAPANGTSFCVAGFVTNETATKTHATALKVIGSWKFADQQPVSRFASPDKSQQLAHLHTEFAPMRSQWSVCQFRKLFLCD